jgi:TonB family protein
MNEGSGRRFRISRRAILIGSVATLAFCLFAAAWLFRPRSAPAAPRRVEKPLATVTVEEAELKAEPNSRSPSIALLPRGTRVAVRDEAGLWVQARAKDVSGFLPVASIERDSDRETRLRRAGTILSFAPVSAVLLEDADLLLAPFPMAPRAGRLEKGTTIRIHSVDHAYYALRGPDGGLAFVDSGKVDVIPPDPQRPVIEPAKERALKDLAVTELIGPLPLAGEAAPPPTPAPGSPGAAAADERLGLRSPEEPLEPAALLSRVDPNYPDAARRAGAQGTVVLEVVIGADGRVVRVDVLKGLPFGLAEAAVDAVRRWQYRPARGRSGPVVSRKEVRIEFRLRS